MPFFPMLQTGPGGAYPRVRAFPVYSGGSGFLAGDLVFYDTTNFGLDRCGQNPTLVLGIAMCASANASLYPGSRVPVATLDPADVIVMDITNNGVAYLPNDQILYKTYGLTRASGGQWQVDINKNASNLVVTVVGYSPIRSTPTGTAQNFGQVFTNVKFLASVLQADSIAS
jgi:hypothetical protein